MMILLILFHIILLLGLSYSVWRKQTALKKFFWPGLALKLIAGVCLGLVYTYYYSVSDTFVYFRDAGKLATLASEDFLSYLRILFLNHAADSLALTFVEPRALFLTKVTSILSFATGNNYWLIGAYFSLISFLGAWYLVSVISRHIPSATFAALIAFVFLPSVVFWSSGLLKESLAMASLYFLTGIFFKTWFDEKAAGWQYVLAVIGLWLLWNLKYYYVAVLFPVVFTTILHKLIIQKRLSSLPALEFLSWFALLTLPIILVTFMHPNFYPGRLMDVIILNNAAYNQVSAPEDLVEFSDLNAAPLSLLANAPWALFSGLVRPLIWEASANIQLLPAVENTVLLIFFAAACTRIRGIVSSPHRMLLLAGTVYIVLLAVLITFSAPNFGTLSRYRVGYLPYFVLIVFSDNPLVSSVERSIRRLVSQ